jgi:hypothetical protein
MAPAVALCKHQGVAVSARGTASGKRKATGHGAVHAIGITGSAGVAHGAKTQPLVTHLTRHRVRRLPDVSRNWIQCVLRLRRPKQRPDAAAATLASPCWTPVAQHRRGELAERPPHLSGR